MEVYGVVYLLIDGTNDKEYVGQTTKTVDKRFNQHAKADTYIGRAIRAHGAEMFVISTLKICCSKEELDYWVRHLINSRNTKDPNGYNFVDGGAGTSKKKFTNRSPEELRQMTAKARSVAMARTPEECGTAAKKAWTNRTSEERSAILEKSWATRRANDAAKTQEEREADAKRRSESAKRGNQERRLTYTALAKLLGLSQPTISEKMRGKLKFTENDIAKLVEIFGKPADYLMARDD